MFRLAQLHHQQINAFDLRVGAHATCRVPARDRPLWASAAYRQGLQPLVDRSLAAPLTTERRRRRRRRRVFLGAELRTAADCTRVTPCDG